MNVNVFVQFDFVEFPFVGENGAVVGVDGRLDNDKVSRLIDQGFSTTYDIKIIIFFLFDWLTCPVRSYQNYSCRPILPLSSQSLRPT